MNFKQFNKSVSLIKIILFFEEKNLRYLIKKSDRKKFIEQYKHIYDSYVYLKKNLLGNRISVGQSKIVYESKVNPQEVIKVFYRNFEYLSITEKQNYDFLVSKKLDHLVPNMNFFDLYCVAEKVEVFEVSKQNLINRTLRRIVKDTNTRNFGLIANRQVCLDIKTLNKTYVKNNLTKLQNLRHY